MTTKLAAVAPDWMSPGSLVATGSGEANDRGYEAMLLEDCTESYFPDFKTATLAMMHAQGGIVGWTCDSGDLLKAVTS